MSSRRLEGKLAMQTPVAVIPMSTEVTTTGPSLIDNTSYSAANATWSKLQRFDTNRLIEVAKLRNELKQQLSVDYSQPTSATLANEPNPLSGGGRVPQPGNPVGPPPPQQPGTELSRVEVFRKRVEEQQEAERRRRKALAESLPEKQDEAKAGTAAVPATPDSIADGLLTKTDPGLEACLDRLQKRESRSKEVVSLDKGNKPLKSVKLHLQMLTNTQRDIKLRVDGTTSEMGPRAILDYVANRAAKQLDSAMQVIADRIVQCASTNLAVDAVLRGDANYGLVYVTLLICHSRPAFIDILKGSLEQACPYIQPGLKLYIENEASKNQWTRELRRSKLGYKDDQESDDDYLLRMQATIGFYAALLQTPQKVLEYYIKLVPHHSGASSSALFGSLANPFGGLVEAWRWLAKTLNGPKWRWTPFLVQAFLCVAGGELSVALPKQLAKILGLLKSKSFKDVIAKVVSKPQDDDRIRSFEKFVGDNIKILVNKGVLLGPGRYEEVDGAKRWVDHRQLPVGAIDNVG